MHTILKRQFIIIILPAVALFLAFGLARQLNFITSGQFVISSVMHSMLFILSVITAIAGPLFIRTLFAHSMRKQRGVPAKEFLSFQRKILWLSMITPYFAFAAVLCDFPRFFAAAIVLMALYAVYYYFPSQKRIDFDRKIFRVK
jgi:Ca2+/Na+ antiporter